MLAWIIIIVTTNQPIIRPVVSVRQKNSFKSLKVYCISSQREIMEETTWFGVKKQSIFVIKRVSPAFHIIKASRSGRPLDSRVFVKESYWWVLLFCNLFAGVKCRPAITTSHQTSHVCAKNLKSRRSRRALKPKNQLENTKSCWWASIYTEENKQRWNHTEVIFSQFGYLLHSSFST